jgi:cyclase
MKVSLSTWLGIALATLGLSGAWKVARAQGNPPRFPGIDYAQVQFATQQLAPNVYTLTGSAGPDPGHPEGAGGRIGVLIGPDGVLLVDGSYAPLTEKIVAVIRTISPAPIRFLIDTHEHPDHTGGNPNFARLGAVIFAREETWEALNQPLPPALAAAIGPAASFTDPQRLPVVTYPLSAAVKIRIDGEIVDLIPAPASHTDGDTIVRFEHADVMMIGDFYRNYGYPFIDTTHGGNFHGVIDALDLVVRLSGPKTKLVPGHGSMITSADIRPYRDMILAVREKVQRMVSEGKTLQDVLAAKLTAPYDAKVRGGLQPLPTGLGTSADRFVSALYAEVQNATRQ